jgi:hypothetical protein
MSTSPGTKKEALKKHRIRRIDDGGDSKPRRENLLEGAAGPLECMQRPKRPRAHRFRSEALESRNDARLPDAFFKNFL